MISLLIFTGLAISLTNGEEIPPCPTGSRPLLRADGQPRKCLPHRNSLCVNALPDNPNADTVCCYHNQVDYFCCLDASADQCPDYHQVTAVIQNPFPQNPFALKSYFFREGIEDEIMEGMVENNQVNVERSGPDSGFIVRHGSSI
ncbi:unnamed protein product, partial [Mesorhabditis belari]|uniref:Uncharacterized protein n=1 Tax=Mesorhabditis belari TaxID=2138241 RepID=A0AAF3JAD5_9BILA